MDRQKRGFTLLELMVVVIIIGILASLAIPRFIVARDKAIEAEAWNMLGALRGSQVRYALEYDNDFSTDVDLLDVEVPYSRYFTYFGANDEAGSSYVAGATGIAATAMENVALWLDENGNQGRGSTLP